MVRVVSGVAVLCLLAAPAMAQTTEGLENERFAVTMFGGGLNGAQELGERTAFGAAATFGAGLTGWLQPWLGARARAFHSSPTLRSENHWLMNENSPAVWLVGADVVVRRPIDNSGLRFAPYMAAGPVAKWYGFSWEGSEHVSGGASVAGGLELWPGRFGLVAELGHIWSRFHARGIRDTSRDWIYTAGLSIPLVGRRPERAMAATPPRD